MKIAVYIDRQGRLVSLYEPGRFCIYEGSGKDWAMTREIAFAVGDGSLAAIKAALAAAAAQFGDCDVLLSGSVKGFLYSLLQEECGFRIWKSDGMAREQLGAVEQHEQLRTTQSSEAARSCAAAASCASTGCGSRKARPAVVLAATSKASSVAAEDLGGGNFRIDLAAELGHNAGLNSREILLPILEGAAFDKLEILCDHLPRWFDAKLSDLNLKAECTPREHGHGVKAIVSHVGGCGNW